MSTTKYVTVNITPDITGFRDQLTYQGQWATALERIRRAYDGVRIVARPAPPQVTIRDIVQWPPAQPPAGEYHLWEPARARKADGL